MKSASAATARVAAATWLFAEGTRVDVFDAEETTWDPPNPVLSERFVRLFRAVYGAVSVAA